MALIVERDIAPMSPKARRMLQLHPILFNRFRVGTMPVRHFGVDRAVAGGE